MYTILVLLPFLSHIFAITSITGRISGGDDISIEQVPYQVSVEYQKRHLNGGSVIASNFILSCARYISGLDTDLVTIRAGTTTRESGGQVVKAKSVYLHPKSNNSLNNYDLSIIELETHLEFGFTAAAISLPSVDQTWPVGTDALITGWGYDEETSQPINLQGLTVQLTDSESCEQGYGYSLHNMFCAGVEGTAEGSCLGDFGGPIQIDGILAGVSSVGLCGLGFLPGIYTNVSLFLDFIEDVITTGL